MLENNEIVHKKPIIMITVITAIIILAVVLFWLAVGRNKTPAEGVMRLDELKILAGETMEVSDKQIISQGDINIEGNLVFRALDGAPAGVEIISESGNIAIAGSVTLAENDGLPATSALHNFIGRLLATPVIAAMTESMPPTTGGQEAVAEISLDGSVIFTARRGLIEIRPTAVIRALNGKNGEDIIVRSLETTSDSESDTEPMTEEEGNPGKHGGNIIFNAPNGDVQIVITRVAEGWAGPSFNFGNGGKGGDIIIKDGEGFPDELPPQMKYTGGEGGESGHFRFSSIDASVSYYTEIQDGNKVKKIGPFDIYSRFTEPILERASIPISGGQGGAGGSVVWFVDGERSYQGVDFIDLAGGRGGDGVVFGGQGGRAEFLSGQVFNDDSIVPKEATHVTVTGGNGGDVFFSRLPVKNARAGNGGEALAIGNKGFAGSDGADELGGEDNAINAARGGNISIYYGHGGAILPGFSSPDKPGKGAAFRIISVEEATRVFFPGSRGGHGAPQTAPIKSSQAGDGGQGGDGCAVTPPGPGGRGGNGGDILEVVAGNGGRGASGGDGGNIYELILGTGGNGGNGQEPGGGGATGALISFRVGEAGVGLNENGRGGQKIAPDGGDDILTNQGYIAVDGESCVETLQEEEDDELAELIRTGNWIWEKIDNSGSMEEWRSFYGRCYEGPGRAGYNGELTSLDSKRGCFDVRLRVIGGEAFGKTSGGLTVLTEEEIAKLKADRWFISSSQQRWFGEADSQAFIGLTSCDKGVFKILTDGYTEDGKNGYTVFCTNCGIRRKSSNNKNYANYIDERAACAEKAKMQEGAS